MKKTTTQLAISHFESAGHRVQMMCKWGLFKIDDAAWITRGQLLRIWLTDVGALSK